MNRFFGLLLLAIFSATGCGQELTAGGLEEGEVSAVATDDTDPAPSNFAASRSPIGRGTESNAASAPSGTLQIAASVVLVRDDGVSEPISSGTPAVSVRIAAADSASLGRRTVDARRYTHARVTFSSVEASVTGGLMIGLLNVVGTVRVPLPQPVTLDAPIDLLVRDEDVHLLIVDLNAADWLAAVDPLTLTVSSATFLSKVRVRVR